MASAMDLPRLLLPNPQGPPASKRSWDDLAVFLLVVSTALAALHYWLDWGVSAPTR
jgi:hypothetical protein